MCSKLEIDASITKQALDVFTEKRARKNTEYRLEVLEEDLNNNKPLSIHRGKSHVLSILRLSCHFFFKHIHYV